MSVRTMLRRAGLGDEFLIEPAGGIFADALASLRTAQPLVVVARLNF
ncbi:hypothetical protein ACFQL1_06095 [Halomicroarcula sp. GCM10025709]|nr:hypothetical protein [Halomicroarcula sp. YJ-61-S]